jgi:hypothetical protein
MKTITIIAGNSDNKLTQVEWSQFLRHLGSVIGHRASQFEFTGGPDTASPFQNFAWVIRIMDDEAVRLREDIKAIRTHFRQDAVAWIEGTTQFI